MIDGYFFKQSELCACHRPIGGGVFAASTTEVAGRSESDCFYVIDTHGNIARPIIVVIQRFGANLESERDFGKILFV